MYLEIRIVLRPVGVEGVGLLSVYLYSQNGRDSLIRLDSRHKAERLITSATDDENFISESCKRLRNTTNTMKNYGRYEALKRSKRWSMIERLAEGRRGAQRSRSEALK